MDSLQVIFVVCVALLSFARSNPIPLVPGEDICWDSLDVCLTTNIILTTPTAVTSVMTNYCTYDEQVATDINFNNTGEIIHQLMTHRSKIHDQLSALDTYASAHTQDYNNQMQVVQTSNWAHTMKGYMQYLMKETGGLVYHDLRCDSSNNPVAINSTPELTSMNDFFMDSVKLIKNLQIFLLNWRKQSNFLDCSEDFDMPSDCQ